MTDWRASAACRAHDPELFFPVGTGEAARAQAARAKAVCSSCSVLEQCLRLAMAADPTDGVFGAITLADRHALRVRARTAAPVLSGS